ncbi:MAG: hypothetical protein WD627_11915 [Actinomycetota bacterium]
MKSHSPSGKIFWFCFAAGWAVLLFGVWGTFENAFYTHPPNFALWFAGSALVHDALVAPAVFLLAWALVRTIPNRIRPAVLAGLTVAALVVAVSLPLVLGRGGAPGNPSALPRNYPLGIALILALITAATVAGMFVGSRGRKQRAPSGSECGHDHQVGVPEADELTET